MKPIRGLLGASAAAVVAAILVVASCLGYFAVRWAVIGADQDERAYDLRNARTEWVGPVVGCALVAGCAGWATFAPNGRHRFAPSLAVVFLASVILWFILGSLELTPRRSKGETHPRFYLSELLIFLGPPFVATAGLTAMRIWRETQRHRPNSTPGVFPTP